MMRSVLAVLAGFMLWTVLWLGSNATLSALLPGAFNADGSTSNSWLLVLILGLSVLFSTLAGYTCAKLAPKQINGPALALGGLLLLVGIMVQAQYWTVMPLWYHLSFLGLLVPAVWLGRSVAAKTQHQPLSQ